MESYKRLHSNIRSHSAKPKCGMLMVRRGFLTPFHQRLKFAALVTVMLFGVSFLPAANSPELEQVLRRSQTALELGEKLRESGIQDPNALRPYLKHPELGVRALQAIRVLVTKEGDLQPETVREIESVLRETQDADTAEPVALDLLLKNQPVQAAVALGNSTLDKIHDRAIVTLWKWLASMWNRKNLGESKEANELVIASLQRMSHLLQTEGNIFMARALPKFAESPPFSTVYRDQYNECALTALANLGRIEPYSHRVLLDYLWKESEKSAAVESALIEMTASGPLDRAKVILWETYSRKFGEQDRTFRSTKVGKRLILEVKKRRPELGNYIDLLEKGEITAKEGVIDPVTRLNIEAAKGP